MLPTSPFLSWILVEHVRLGLFWATRAWVLVLVVPLIVVAVGEDGESPPGTMITTLRKDPTTGGAPIFSCPYAGLIFSCWCWVHAPMATGERIALAMTVGVVADVSINATMNSAIRATFSNGG